MRTALSISLAFASMIACGNSAGQGIWIEGTLDCGEWVAARKAAMAQYYEHYLLGVLNGLSMGRRVDIWRIQDNKMSREQAYLWMHNYCQSNPLSNE